MYLVGYFKSKGLIYTNFWTGYLKGRKGKGTKKEQTSGFDSTDNVLVLCIGDRFNKYSFYFYALYFTLTLHTFFYIYQAL